MPHGTATSFAVRDLSMDLPSLASNAKPSPGESELSAPIHRIGTLPIRLTVRLCHRTMKFRDFANLTPGNVISFETPSDSQLELIVGEKTLARGTAVRQGTRLGLRIDRFEPSCTTSETK
jgi:flagellar motor switch/type III secretory pathway protein FliN